MKFAATSATNRDSFLPSSRRSVFSCYYWSTVLVVLVVSVDPSSWGVDAQHYDDEDDYGDYQDYPGSGMDMRTGGGPQPDYYSQDTLYHDYAARQQDKMMDDPGAVAPAPQGPGLVRLVIAGAVSWWMGGKVHSSGVLKKAKVKFQKEQKQLYSQYYNDVYKLTEQNQELQYLIEQYQDALQQTKAQHELEALQRDYDEFKQPDIDGDDKISRAEFNMYVKNYLSHYPGLSEKDYPRFEDFDHDGDGYVSFQEYAQQMALQAQKAEKDAMKTGGNSKANQKAQAMQELYGDSTKGKSFEDVYKQYL